MNYAVRILILFWIVGLTTSCSRLLDLQPETDVSDDGAVSDRKTALAALFGIYDNFQNTYTSALTAFNLAGDNVINYNNPTIVVPDRNAEDNGGAPFAAFYVAINRANFLIKHVPGIVDNQFTEQERQQVVGEAYFLRALAYFELARFYGGVQLVTVPTERIDTHKGVHRSTLEETYAQVLSDLSQAEALINNEADRSRVSRIAVYALKARLFLYMERWEEAEIYASRIIESSQARLVRPFSAFYTGLLTEESIFEIIHTASDPTTYWRSWLAIEDGGNQTYVPEPSLTSALRDPARGGDRNAILKESTRESGLFTVQLYGKTNGTSSLFVLRLAEQYLIRAEARVRKSPSDIAGAVDDIRIVQERAGVVPLFSSEGDVTQDNILLAIEEERRLELAFEGHRFTDLVRTGRAADVLGRHNPLLKQSYQWVFPIPASSVEKDPDLIQNPGY